jgi:hypothetical protein
VISTNDSIEGILFAQHGFVVFTHPASNISGVSKIALSADSVLKTTIAEELLQNKLEANDAGVFTSWQVCTIIRRQSRKILR